MADIEVETEVTGNVWKVLCQVGDRVETEQELVILESMKMEIPVEAPQARDGESTECQRGRRGRRRPNHLGPRRLIGD